MTFDQPEVIDSETERLAERGEIDLQAIVTQTHRGVCGPELLGRRRCVRG